MEGENWLLQVILWPLYHHTYIDTINKQKYLKIKLKLQAFGPTSYIFAAQQPHTISDFQTKQFHHHRMFCWPALMHNEVEKWSRWTWLFAEIPPPTNSHVYSFTWPLTTELKPSYSRFELDQSCGGMGWAACVGSEFHVTGANWDWGSKFHVTFNVAWTPTNKDEMIHIQGRWLLAS